MPIECLRPGCRRLWSSSEHPTPEAFGNQVFGIEGFFSSDPEAAKPHLERFFADVVPVVRAEARTAALTPW